MGRESREVWKRRVERWRDGGLSAGEFAAELGVNPRTLTYWKWRLGSESKKRTQVSAPTVAMAPQPTFVEVTPPSPEQHEPFELVVGGLIVRVPCVFDAEALKRLIAAVRV